MKMLIDYIHQEKKARYECLRALVSGYEDEVRKIKEKLEEVKAQDNNEDFIALLTSEKEKREEVIELYRIELDLLQQWKHRAAAADKVKENEK